MDPEYYKSVAGILPTKDIPGGQELILLEIVALLKEHKRVWLPFYSSGTLAEWLEEFGHEVLTADRADAFNECPSRFDALYFGTPTIVNGKELFQEGPLPMWTKERERRTVRSMRIVAENSSCRLIVSGLGSGDISVGERLRDMGGGKVVCFKDFGDFQDWVLARKL